MFENFMMIPGRDDDKKLGRESLLKRSIDGRWVRGGGGSEGIGGYGGCSLEHGLIELGGMMMCGPYRMVRYPA